MWKPTNQPSTTPNPTPEAPRTYTPPAPEPPVATRPAAVTPQEQATLGKSLVMNGDTKHLWRDLSKAAPPSPDPSAPAAPRAKEPSGPISDPQQAPGGAEFHTISY